MNAQAPAPVHMDIDAEQALLGAIMVDERALDEIMTVCTVADFSDPFHQRIVLAAKALRAESMHVSPLTIRAKLGDDPAWQQIEPEYLKSLARSAPSDATIAACARIVADVSLRRRLDEELEAARGRLSAAGSSVMESLAGVLEAAGEAAERAARRKASISAGDAAHQLMKAFDEPEEKVLVIPTGLEKLDEIIGGARPGQLIIVAGRPGMGKSTLATHLARVAALHGRPVDYHSLEMTGAELSARLITDLDYDGKQEHEWALSYSRLYRRKATEREQARALQASLTLQKLPITIHDPETRPGIAEICALQKARSARYESMGLVIIDHIGLVAPSSRYAGQRVNEISEVTGQAKALAKAIRCPVVLLSQLSRAVEQREEKKPTLSDLRDSGSIEQDADIVIGMYRHAYYLEQKRPDEHSVAFRKWQNEFNEYRNKLDLVVLKNRMGKTGAVPVACDMGASVIRDSGVAS